MSNRMLVTQRVESIFTPGWRLAIIAAATLVFCSCRGAGSDSGNWLAKTSGPRPQPAMQPNAQPMMQQPVAQQRPAAQATVALAGYNDGALPQPVTTQPAASELTKPHSATAQGADPLAGVPQLAMRPGHHHRPHGSAMTEGSCPICPRTPGGYPEGAGITAVYPMEDEYLCDGGDRNLSVRIKKDYAVYGLDTKDTVAHFDTLDGRRIVEPSNRVCIYAPRFGSVRQIHSLELSEGKLNPYGVEHPLKLGAHDDAQLAGAVTQPRQPVGDIVSIPLGTFRDQQKPSGSENVRALVGIHDHLLPYEDSDLVLYGVYKQADKPELSAAIKSAITWTSDVGVQVAIRGESTEVLEVEQHVQGVFQTKLAGKPAIRIVKMASRQEAKSGDIVEFTLRYDNVGSQEIGNVTLIDNLTTRLEYVPDSQQSSAKADFMTQENEAGSLVLRWEIRDPLKPGEGGIVRFKCKVR